MAQCSECIRLFQNFKFCMKHRLRLDRLLNEAMIANYIDKFDDFSAELTLTETALSMVRNGMALHEMQSGHHLLTGPETSILQNHPRRKRL